MRSAVKDFLGRWPRLFAATKGLWHGLRGMVRTGKRAVWLAARGSVVQRYLAEHEVPKLQIGTGPIPRPDWLNSDLDPAQRGTIFLDASRPLPFADETFEYIYAEHMIEHVPYDAACSMLGECLRVLRPGGRIRIATPDLERLVRVYEDRRDLASDQAAYVDWIARRYISSDRALPVFVLNNAFRAWGHQFLFDEETLRSTLCSAGFTEVRRCEVAESDDAQLRDLEAHGSTVGNAAANEFETLVVEAERPGRSTSDAGGAARVRAASPEGGSSTAGP
jgi:predicted SAM-dependent methyltransferase